MGRIAHGRQGNQYWIPADIFVTRLMPPLLEELQP